MRIDPIEFVAKARGGIDRRTGSTLTPAPHHRGRQFLGFDVVLLLRVAPLRRCSPRPKSGSPLLGRNVPTAGRQDLPRLLKLDSLLHIVIVYRSVLFWQNEANRPRVP